MDAASQSEAEDRHLPAPRAAPRPFLHGQRGVGLVELLVVAPMMAIILMGIYALYNVGVTGQRQTHDRVAALARQQNGIERMTREMRQAISFLPVSSQILDAETYVRPADGTASVARHVRYECADGACVRYEGVAGETTFDTSETVIPGVRNADVFFFEPDNVSPTYVAVKVEVAVRGANRPIVLQGGFGLRNHERDGTG